MLKLKQLIIFIFIAVFLIISVTVNSYASFEPVTEENLNNALQSFVSSEDNSQKYQISMSDGKINISVDGKNYTLNYDLTDNPKFYISVPIQEGMSYDEFNEEINNLILPMLGYMGVANIQGENPKDIIAYFSVCAVISAFSNLDSFEYVVADDGSNLNYEGKKVIYKSEFKNHVMEYTNSLYSTKKTFTDDENIGGFNTFSWTVEQTDVTSTSCNLLTTLTVNKNADFSRLKGYADSLSLYKDITEQTADYVVKLKVGQKCQIKSNEEILGYELSGDDCVDFTENNNIITGTKVGTRKGYLFVGSQTNKKSIYISVEENTNNEALDVIVLNIDQDNKASNTNVTTQVNNNSENSVSNTSIIPRTGEKENPILTFAYVLIALGTIGMLILIITRK